MAWQQLKIKATLANAELISDLLLGLGAKSVTIVDAANHPIYEPKPGTTPLWENCQIQALLADDTNSSLLLEQLHMLLGNQAIEFNLDTLAEKDWSREWMHYFKPMRFGKNLWVCPTHETITEDNAVIIKLDPGLAFGTGTHSTTALCLEWLSKHNLNNKTVIDYGTGSGILAIAASKLGAQKVVAVDNDSQALTATHHNALQNDVVIASYLPEDFTAFKADILIANILANPLIDLASLFKTFVKNQGQIILSGILLEQAESVMHAYEPEFAFQPLQVKEEWVLLHGRFGE